MVIKLKQKKQTRNSVVYDEDTEIPVLLNSLYFQKIVLKQEFGEFPDELKLQITSNGE